MMDFLEWVLQWVALFAFCFGAARMLYFAIEISDAQRRKRK
jgi:hypothetical protein